MRRGLLLGGIALVVLLLAGLGAVISLFRSVTSVVPSLACERSATS